LKSLLCELEFLLQQFDSLLIRESIGDFMRNSIDGHDGKRRKKKARKEEKERKKKDGKGKGKGKGKENPLDFSSFGGETFLGGCQMRSAVGSLCSQNFGGQNEKRDLKIK
jgi:hypothetical protein